MENKINIAEILKDCSCSSGMELDCTIYEDVYFDYVDELNIIHCYIQHETYKTSLTFNQYGIYNSGIKAKCVIFPKGKTTWEGFHRPYKGGDVIVVKTYKDIIFYSIYKGIENSEVLTYVDYALNDNRLINVNNTLCYTCEIIEQRLATEEEKEKLFQAIKDNGYKWDAETKTLEKLVEPRFKVGDRIKAICNNNQYDIKELTDTHYTLVEVKYKFKYTEPISEDKKWELVPSKFDISTLIPFESRVLVRNKYDDFWEPAIFGVFYAKEHAFKFCIVGSRRFEECIPYECNEHLLGTTDDCDEYYKTWE